ncbi:MAG: hypothetical protein WCT50_04625, partial [Patescibacteria group bacterium]
MRKNFFILGLLASFLLIGLSAKATDGLTISVDNSRKMLSDGSAIISWNVNIEPEYCGIDYSPNSDLSGGIGTNGALVQAGLATNDGKFYYVVNLNNLDSNKDYYYKVICTLKGDNLVYKSEIKKLSKYEVTPASTITVSKTGTGSGTVFEGTFLEMGSVINCGNKCSASFMSGASAITLTASPASGSVFTSWTGCGSNTTNPVCIVQIGSSTHNIIANFTTTTISPARTITVSKTGTGSGTVFEGTFLEMGSVINCGDKCSASFMTNTSAITLTASPATGSVFTSWQGCGSNTTNPVCVVQIGSSTSNVIANFSTQQVVPANDFKVTKIGTGSGTVFEGTFLESGSVINCGDKCSASFMTSASAITLTAIPDQNSKFMGWFGNCDSGINDPSKTTCIVTPNKAKTVIAAFSTNPVTNLPRIMYWSGKVNQHWNISSSKWETDSDGLSGAGLDKLNYCKKYYPQTVSISPFKEEVTSSWKDGGNVGAYTSVKQSYLCVQGNGTSTPFIYPATAKTDSVSVLTTPKTTNSTNSAVSNITTVNSTTASSADDSIILKLQRKITELETKVIELEKRATQLDQKFANKYAGTM